MRAEKNSNLAHLRIVTQGLHRQLDQSPLVRMLLSADMTLAHYRRLLLGFYQAYLRIEPAILAFEAAQRTVNQPLLTPAFKPRLPALRAELKHLDEHLEQVTIENPPLQLGCLAEYWGMRYVLDGSCHGAKWLLPRLQQNFQLSNVSHFEYWTLLAKINPHWPAICQAIDAQPPQVEQQQTLINAAQSTFELFIKQLDHPGATQ